MPKNKNGKGLVVPDPLKKSEPPETKVGYIADYISGVIVRAGTEEVEATQVFSRRLVEDYGYKKGQIQTHPQWRVRKRPSDEKREYPIDIAVFKDSRKTEDNLFLIVECKQEKRKDGRRQLELYMDMSPAQIGVWFNGKEHLYLRKIVKKDGSVLYVELPSIPKSGERMEDIGKYRRKDLRPTANLKDIFKDVRNHLAGNVTGITRDEALAQQIINLLFCKIYDELNSAPDEIVTFRAGVEEEPQEIKKRIVDLFEGRVKTSEYGDVLENDKITLDADSITYVIGELQNYAITKAERDVIGDAFEVFIGPALRGEEGQFFTPRNIVKLVIEILDPDPEEYVIDPACGSGGFLIVALEYVWQKVENEGKRRGMSKGWVKEKQRRIASEFFRGVDKDSFLAKVTKAYMAIIGDGRSGIFCENSLEPESEWNYRIKDKVKLGMFDVVMTNPPFGAKIAVKGEDILSQYELGYHWKKDKETGEWVKTNQLHDKQPPQTLFIERCLQLLKEGGRLGIVLPESYLHAKSYEHILRYTRQYKVLHIIDLAHATFQPHCNAKTVVLILQKTKPKTDYDINLSIAETVGHDHTGRTLYKVDTKTHLQTDEVDDQLPSIVDKVLTKRSGKPVQESSLLFSLKNSKTNPVVLVPRYYWREYQEGLEDYAKTNGCEVIAFSELVKRGIVKVYEGHGSPEAFFKGTGEIPYVRVADIVNWEVYKNPTALIPEDVYLRKKGNGLDLEVGDVLFVKRGSYRIGSVAIISPFDKKVLLTKEILIFRIAKLKNEYGLSPFYLIYLLSLPVVLKQIDNKVLMETTLPNISDRWKELLLPIAKSQTQRESVSKRVENAFSLKWQATEEIGKLMSGGD